jgi:dephospho-CoA kinase
VRDLHDLLLARVDELVPELLPGAQRVGDEWRAGSVQGERGDSLAVDCEKGLWIDHNPSAPEPRKGNLLTLIQAAKGLSPEEARRWARQWLGLSPSPKVRRTKAGSGPKVSSTQVRGTPSTPVPEPSGSQVPEESDPFDNPRFRDLLTPRGEDEAPLAPASEEVLRRMVSRLLRTPEAVAYLKGRGLDARVVRRFYLGLDDTARATAALVYPVIGPDGSPVRRHLYYEIPGLTQSAPGKGWGRGRPTSYWALPPFEGPTPRRKLLVCEGAKDAWALWLHLHAQPWAQDLAVVTSTHGSALPEAWKDPLFWAPWEEVYLGQDADPAGEEMARKVAEAARRPVRRLRVPEGMGKDWTDYFLAGGTPEGFRLLLEGAEVWEGQVAGGGARIQLPDPVDIQRAFVRGHLYVPVRILENRGEDGARYRTVVVRSDGAVLGWGYLPAPPGTPLEDRVLALDDGTIIRRPPRAAAGTSWSGEAINRFLEARARGVSAMTVAPKDLPGLIVRHLRQVLLPGEDGYLLAALGVMTSYVQSVFDAVPLFLVVGPPGSGKTEFARLMAELGANGVVITGQTSAATAARIIDETGGLVAFDDLEEVRQRSGSAEASQLEQFLKVSYKKETAVKSWTDTKGMRVLTLNFFGVKVITNTQGTGDILGSRMLVIRTARLRDLGRGEERRPEGLSPQALQELRDNLYIWAMENAASLHALYRERFAGKGERLDEIAAPLRTIAHHLGDEELAARLEEALRRQEGRLEETLSDAEVVETALKEAIRQGYRSHVALVHVIFQARKIFGDDWGRERTVDIPRWRDPKWVGQIARNYGWAAPERPVRPRLWDKQFRVMRLEPTFVERVVRGFLQEGVPLEPLKQPLAFCLDTPCAECAYLHWCDLRPDKEKWLERYGEAKLAQKRRELEEEFLALVGPQEDLGLQASAEEEGDRGKYPGTQDPKASGTGGPRGRRT